MNQEQSRHKVAYFSMEIGLQASMPTYGGGLGILAGDTLRAAADIGAPLVGITLLYRKGYFRQHLDEYGNQTEEPAVWSPEEFLEPMPHKVSVTIEGREVRIRAWRYIIRGITGREVPVYFLDTALTENTPEDQALTDYLYGGDQHYRICQEVILGIGGLALLRELAYDRTYTFHLNEGHAAFLPLALLSGRLAERDSTIVEDDDLSIVREQSVFTTHTPVPAGHDQFPIELVQKVLGERFGNIVQSAGCDISDTVNMTFLALFLSRYVNGVAMKHSEISHGHVPAVPNQLHYQRRTRADLDIPAVPITL